MDCKIIIASSKYEKNSMNKIESSDIISVSNFLSYYY